MLTLKEVRGRIVEKDETGLEAFLIDASDDYQIWINKRHNSVWEGDTGTSNISMEHTIAGNLFGGSIAKRLFGDEDKKGK
jgi:hypothetical protein